MIGFELFQIVYASEESLKGLNSFKPGRRKSISFPVTMVSP